MALPPRQQHTTIQFNHRWLPLNASHSIQAESTGKLCPHCLSEDESHQHFLQCPHPAPVNQWTNATQQVIHRLRKYNKNIDNTLIQLITLSILEWRTTKSPARPQFLQPQYHQLFHAQSLIGWDQIIQGRFSTQWQRLQQQINPKIPVTWISFTIRTIWYYVYDIWKFRCNTNHGSTPQNRRQRALLRLTPKLITLYNHQNDIDPIDKNIFEKTQEEMLQLPTHILEKWIYKAHIRITDSIKRQKQKTRQNHHPILTYFYRIVTPVEQRPIPNIQIHEPHNPLIPLNRQPNLITRTINNFFQRRPPPAPHPYIPIPHNDDRPP
jgi:hypothetical protein